MANQIAHYVLKPTQAYPVVQSAQANFTGMNRGCLYWYRGVTMLLLGWVIFKY